MASHQSQISYICIAFSNFPVGLRVRGVSCEDGSCVAPLFMSLQNRDQEILAINQAMLNSVAGGDWEHYSQVCSDDVSCFEAESEGHLVEGLSFHRYYFDLPNDGHSVPSPVTVTMARPHLRWLSDDAVVLSYTRLTQRLQSGEPMTSRCCETRVWQRIANRWLQVHVHRS